MHRGLFRGFVITLLLSGLTTVLVQSQTEESLGDIARANRAQQEAQETSGPVPKVITNKDLPAGSTTLPQSSTSDSMTMVSGVQRPDRQSDQQPSNRLLSQQRTDAQWRARIQDQENRIAALQARIDRVNASIRGSVGTAEYDTPANRYQAIQMERLSTMEETLNQQKQKLAMMQDAARRAGTDQ